MLIERSAHASVFLEGSIFVAGGQTTTKKNTKYLDKMEKYGIQFSWTLLFFSCIYFFNFKYFLKTGPRRWSVGALQRNADWAIAIFLSRCEQLHLCNWRTKQRNNTGDCRPIWCEDKCVGSSSTNAISESGRCSCRFQKSYLRDWRHYTVQCLWNRICWTVQFRDGDMDSGKTKQKPKNCIVLSLFSNCFAGCRHMSS